MRIKLDDLKKLESSNFKQKLVPGKGSVEAIVKVDEPNYVPKTVKVRAQIDAQMFTCEITAKQLTSLENDPKVASIAVSKKLNMIE